MQTLENRSNSLADTLKIRRQRLAEHVSCPVILWSGCSQSRNFPANVYPFRASSHFLYFAGLPLANAVIRLNAGRLQLFMDDPSPDSTLWHGESPSRATIAAAMGADEALPLAELRHWLVGSGTIAVQDPTNSLYQAHLLERMLAPATRPQGLDLDVTNAIIQLRLTHDQAALAEMRQAAQVSMQAHRAGMAATHDATLEAEVRAAIEAVFMANQMTCAYTSIVTVHGEVLHHDRYDHALQAGDLLLVDAGAETATGWAADITRTWPVSGKFSSTQQAIYDVVLAAHDVCIAAMRPGVEYRDIHLLGARTIAAGLVDLGILNGQPDDLVEQDAHALFFPHGIGHLLGLDVHDMEDLGDRAGYAEGRTRSDRFGLGYLRLDRPLQAGMVVTIEPGFYQVPAILNDPERRTRYQHVVNWDRLTQFADVRGIRIEDDVLITATGTEVLTAALPTSATAIEALVGA
ncbi:aminopeptidase P family protein [Pantanalinema rosaneae CENA516]|uniref:aminopeptidase P family protein n=1 Tax=Pantanalinema rosaneae TaxID=1620701 RepID=UPI003D6EAE0B